MMGSPVPVLAVLSLYLLVVLKLGPEYMKDKAPYKLKNVMRIYNIAQVIYNAAILYIVSAYNTITLSPEVTLTKFCQHESWCTFNNYRLYYFILVSPLNLKI